MLMPTIFRENLLDNFFDDFDRPMRPFFQGGPHTEVMKTDIKESDKAFELDIDLPGYKKEDVKVELNDGCVTISCERKAEEETKGHRYVRRERYYGTASRSFYVGDDIKQEEIKAKFENGILRLTVPKKEAEPEIEKARFIEIE